MIRLVFLNVHFVVVHYEERLSKFDVMNEANKLVLTTIVRAVTENTAEIDDREN